MPVDILTRDKFRKFILKSGHVVNIWHTSYGGSYWVQWGRIDLNKFKIINKRSRKECIAELRLAIAEDINPQIRKVRNRVDPQAFTPWITDALAKQFSFDLDNKFLKILNDGNWGGTMKVIPGDEE